MQPAADSTVLGDFNHASFSHDGITTSFFRRDSRFMVRTDGPDGALHEYAIDYTFGVYPLQQYLIAMPGGRLQALGIAWDSRPRASGGHRWFFLYPGQQAAPADPLHWTGIDQTWNYMCADCHSTNLRKNYSLQTRTYSTAYAEIDVACEACHGPGSNHVSWARKSGGWQSFTADRGLTIALNERDGIRWSINSTTGNPERSAPRLSEREIQMCARCHSRRTQIHEDTVHGQPAGDDYRVALLDPDLYFPDGQVKGEVYEYGSFIQSRMFHAGVTCSDCHEPHSLKLRADGNNVCLQCHYAARYDSSKHHFHQTGSAGAQCVACHMPTRTYMVVDPRRDHSLRIPRPDLSVTLGTPNACTSCHTGKPAQWASAAINQWYGRTPVGFQRFAGTLHAGSIGAPDAQPALAALVADQGQPAIARASALSMLASFAPAPADAAVHIGVTDDSPLVRRAAAQALANVDPAASASLIAPLLSDRVRAVRSEAAEALAGVSPDALSAVTATSLGHDTDEYIAIQQLNADRPEAHLNLALLYAREKHFQDAEAELKIALSLDPAFAPAAVNLADLYRAHNRDADGAQVLHDAITHSPADASLQHALGLLMVRQHQNAQALVLLAAAARLDPANSRYSYVYAIALNDAGQSDAAIETLERNLAAHPYDRDSLAALAGFCIQAGKPGEALTYAIRLDQVDPGDPQVRQMIQSLNGQLHH
ncbi:MAG: HEAT repeat domain-containing protein [Candidatus Binataceae bacterium]|nr:HEAT repeat domain-containing protein [Candidatus Binataceae bacterium]